MAEVEGGTPITALALDPSPATTACDWPVAYVDCAGACSAWENWPEAERATAQAWFEAQAVDLLHGWTGRVFGVCEAEIRPCRDAGGTAGDGQSTFWGRGPGYDPTFPRAGGGSRWQPVLIRGEWFNIGCGCLSACGCSDSGADVLAIPGPVTAIDTITIGGEVIPPSAYRVEHGRLLRRLDGGVWPASQSPEFVIRYSRGIPVPVGGQVAAGRLACELALAACAPDDCALPERLQTVSRQGITVGVSLTGEDWRDTGIWSIDSWVQSMTIPRSFASVRSVDVRPRHPGY